MHCLKESQERAPNWEILESPGCWLGTGHPTNRTLKLVARAPGALGEGVLARGNWGERGLRALQDEGEAVLQSWAPGGLLHSPPTGSPI